MAMENPPFVDIFPIGKGGSPAVILLVTFLGWLLVTLLRG